MMTGLGETDHTNNRNVRQRVADKGLLEEMMKRKIRKHHN